MKIEFGDNRMAHIFSLFCRTPTQDAAALAVRLEISERTVRNDIKQLNTELRDCASIEGSQGKFTLHIYDADRFREVRDRILEGGGDLNSPSSRQDYLFGRLMRAAEPLLTDELAYEMNVGRSTLVSDLKRLRAALEPYQLSVQGKTSIGLTLQGREQDVRHYILEHCFDTLYRDYPLDEEIVAFVQDAFAQSPVGHTTRQRFERFLTVMLDRFLNGHPIGELSTAFYRLAARPEFEAVNRLADQIAEFLHTEIPVEERLFVLLPIAGMRTPADVMDMRSIQLDPAMRPLQEKIFRQIKLEMDLQIANSEFEEEFLVAGVSLHEMNEKAMKGTLLAHVDGGAPNLVITIDKLDDCTFGELVYFFWKSLAVSGYMIGVNPFDQPGVEAYKKNMFALLGKPGYDDMREALEARLEARLKN